MNYKEAYEAAKKNADTKEITAQYLKMDKKGDFVVGRYIGRTEVVSGLGSGSYFMYLFHTDAGLVKFSLGKATDNEAGQVMVVDGVYAIEFLGQEKIKGGRHLNRYKIEEIPAEGVEGPAQEDI